MTTPYERTRTVIQTREFLQWMLKADQSDASEKVKQEARRLLRHYPSDADLRDAERAVPDVWGPPDCKIGG